MVALVLAGSSAAGSSRAPHNRSLPKVGGQPSAGKILSAGHGRWSNRPTTFRYAWQTCNATGRSCRIVSGAKKRSFTLRVRDVGHRMRVVVVAVNRAGRGVGALEADGAGRLGQPGRAASATRRAAASATRRAAASAASACASGERGHDRGSWLDSRPQRELAVG